jgi:FlaA1/EpsC-like NDP-sugar epimerase
MTIPEAAELVIQAGSMGGNGDVFILDMGKQIKIEDLARRMVSLSGLTVRDNNNPNGDITIKTTKLRPGEKLHEELLIGTNITDTAHPYIMRSHESSLPWSRVQQILIELELACYNEDSSVVRKIFKEIVDGYKPQCGIEDVVWLAANKNRKARLTNASALFDQTKFAPAKTTPSESKILALESNT